MRKNEDIIRSISTFLINLVEVPGYGYVYERTQEESAIPKIDAGEVVVFFSKGVDFESSPNHPKFRLNLLLVAKASSDAILKINHIKDIIEGAVIPVLSFDFYCYDTGSAVLDGQLVVLNTHTVQYYLDKDRYIYQPINLEIGYANKF